MKLTKYRVMQVSAWMTAASLLHVAAINIFVAYGLLLRNSDLWPVSFKVYCDFAFILMSSGVIVLWLAGLSHSGARIGTKNKSYGWWFFAQLFLPILFSLIYYLYVYSFDLRSTQQVTGAESA